MRLAAIDIGTNSIHMIVVQVKPDLSFEVIDREKEMVRLGAGGLGGKSLTPAATAVALQTLSKFARLAESHKVDEIIAAATSATREADNGGDFIAEVARQTGIRVRIISGTEEARLIHLAACYGVDVRNATACVIDMGGGSVEVTLGTASQMIVAQSFKTGVIRVTERFVKTDPLEKRDERKLVKHIQREMKDHLRRIRARGYDRVIGTSGTILSLGALVLAEAKGRTEELRNQRVPFKALHKLRKRLVASNIQERLRFPGMDPRRADLSVGGVIVLDTILAQLGADELTLCDLALREGLVLDYIRSNQARIRKADRYPDVRRRSVIELAERCNYWAEHAQQVARLALAIFDQTRSHHQLTSHQREWLEYAALLHDVGVHISYEKHHRHSYYLVKHGDLRGFEPREIEIIALVTRYHRQSEPKKSHDGFRDLAPKARRVVKQLSAMLRLAEGLDRSHAQAISRLDLFPRNGDYVARLRTDGDAELELWAAHRHVQPLEKVLKHTIRFELAGRDPRTPDAHADKTDDTPRVPRKTVRGRRNRRVRKNHAARAPREVA